MQIKYVHKRTRADGTPYWVFNPGKYLKDALGVTFKPFDTEQEAIEYSQQVQDDFYDHKRRQDRKFHIQDDTVNGIFAYYQAQDEWIDTKPSTKTTFKMLMSVISNARLGTANIRFGDMLAKNVSNDHAKALKTLIQEEYSPHRALHCMKVLRLIWNIALRANRVKHNPFSKMRIKAMKPRTVCWESSEVDTFIKQCDSYGYPNLSLLALMCYHLCQRPGDMRQVTFTNIVDGELDFIQEKTGTALSIEITDEIIERIDALGRSEGTIVVNDETGNPHTRWSYYKQAKKMIIQAGLPEHLRISDLRRTGATEMAESESTEDEIRAVTGHQSRDVLNIYVRPTRAIARNGMRRRFGGRRK